MLQRPHPRLQTPLTFLQVDDESKAAEYIQELNTKHWFTSLDLETTGLSPFQDKILCATLWGGGSDTVVMIPGSLCHLLSDLKNTIVYHNSRFDIGMLKHAGIDLRHKATRDTLILSHLENENKDSHSLDALVKERFNDPYKEEFWAKYKAFQDAPMEEQISYACMDVVYTGILFTELLSSLSSIGIPESLIEHQHSLAMTLLNTELDGIKVDVPYLTEIGLELKPKIVKYAADMRGMVDGYCRSVELDRLAEATKKAWTPTGKKWLSMPIEPFNFDSTVHLKSLLYSKLKLPEQKKKSPTTKQLVTSVDDESLSKIASLHPIVEMVQDYRVYQKAYTAFIEGTLAKMVGGRVYPKFNVTGTVTGRISSSEPNMQQLPSKGEWAKIRGIYVPEDGYKIVSCDFSQLEVVVAAHYSHDTNLLKIINEGASKHDITADALGVERHLAKTINFAMQYQCSAMKIAEILKCSKDEAQRVWDTYWETYAGEKRVIEDCKEKVDQGLPIVNPFGRQRRFPKQFEQHWQKSAAYRQAYSSLIQGTGADCCNWSVYTADRILRKRGIGKILFSVHDELVAMIKSESVEEGRQIISETMIESGKVARLTLPLSVDCSEGLDRWQK